MTDKIETYGLYFFVNKYLLNIKFFRHGYIQIISQTSKQHASMFKLFNYYITIINVLEHWTFFFWSL